MSPHRTTPIISTAAPAADAGGSTSAPGAAGGSTNCAEYMARRARVSAIVMDIEPVLKSGRSFLDVRAAMISSGNKPDEVDEALDAVTDPETGTVEKDPFPRITYNYLRSYTVNKADHIVGDGFIRRGAGTLITGGTGLGKSVLAEQFAVSIACGIPVLRRIKVNSPCRVLYCQPENDEETLKRDILSITDNAPGKPCPVLVQANLFLHHVYGLTGERFSAWLDNRVRRDKPDVVFIDPYQGFIGGADINQSETFLLWIEPIERIIKSNRCALVIVAHTPKPRDRSHWSERESVYMAAGSSVLSNWARCSAELTQDGSQDGRFRLRFGKNAERNGLYDEHGRIIRDLFIEHSGRRLEPFWRVSEEQASKPIVIGKYDDRIRAMITTDASASDAHIAKAIGCDRSTVYRVRGRLSL